jgi:hypothetical protein
MNKKLIKELEACGFVRRELYGDLFLCLDVKEHELRYNTKTDNFYNEDTDGLQVEVWEGAFAQIAEKVLELTGVTLTPKQTKRQEIDTLREELETVKSTLNNLSDWAMSENKRRDVDLRVLKYNLKKNGILVDPLTEPKSEPVKTEGVFNVGDPVVLVCEIELHYMDRLKMAIRDSLVCVVTELIEEECDTGYWVKIPNNDSRFWFIKSELQHAPKAFKVGDPVETFYSVGKAGQRVLIVSQSDLDNEPLCTTKAPKEAAKVLEFGDMLESLVENDGVKVGQKVVFLSKSVKKYKEDVPEGLKEYHVIDEWTNHYSMTADSFKGFDPREKVLKLGGWAETLTDGIYIKKGAKVLLCNVRVDDSYCYDEKGNNNWVENDNLKAL